MLTSKQRAKLRSAASTADAIFQVGKNAVSNNMLDALSSALDARELIKITILQSCDYDAVELMKLFEIKLHAEAVCKIGNKIVLYRKSTKDGVEHIEL